MADDMSGKIMDMLNNPELIKKVSEAINGSGGAVAPILEKETQDELTSSVKNIMGTLNRADDRRVNLLNAIKPYMRETRAAQIDKAIQMLKLTKLAELFKIEN